ncbi:hypothetical protein MRBBS_1440 [Marinobacter sp. BSs20148]|nr:hypothetical protein MRBBS_1440 [Marinobacter sp. BSs20148]
MFCLLGRACRSIRGRIQDINSWPPWPLLFHYYFVCVYVFLPIIP